MPIMKGFFPNIHEFDKENVCYKKLYVMLEIKNVWA
jgi:hypothetical protein